MNAPNEAREIQENIAGLASPNAAVRAAAATLLYGHGVLLALAVLEQWTKDPELAELLRPSRTAHPEPAGAGSLPYTIGVAVTPQGFENIRAANGSPRLAEVPPDQDALEFELRFGPVQLDILTSKAPGGGGVIAKFLEKFGESIQQIEHVVRDVDRATELLRTRMGVQPVYPQTRPGADGTRVNFFLAQTPDGKKVLIELVEEKK